MKVRITLSETGEVRTVHAAQLQQYRVAMFDSINKINKTDLQTRQNASMPQPEWVQEVTNGFKSTRGSFSAWYAKAENSFHETMFLTCAHVSQVSPELDGVFKECSGRSASVHLVQD